MKLKMMLTLFFLLFLVGCSSSPPGEVDVFTGTGAIEIETARNAPPDEVFESSFFLVSLDLQNRGAFSLFPTDTNTRTGYISVNYDSLYLRVQESNLDDDGMIPFFLEGRSLTYPRGERDLINIARFEAADLDGGLGQPSTTIRVDACYPYETSLVQTVCIDADIFEEQTNPICQNRGSYRFSGQGAPLAVTNIEVLMIPEGLEVSDAESQPLELPDFLEGEERRIQDEQFRLRPRFNIEFENRGQGRVFRDDISRQIKDQCIRFEANRSAKFDMQAYLLNSNKTLKCQNDGVLTLRNGRGNIICELESSLNISRNIEDRLAIDAQYLYTTQTDKTIEIVRR